MFNKFVYVMSGFWIAIGVIFGLTGDPPFGIFAVFCGFLAIAFIKRWI